jgi:hypothetical protein
MHEPVVEEQYTSKQGDLTLVNEHVVAKNANMKVSGGTSIEGVIGIEGVDNTSIEGVIGIESVDNTGIKGASKIGIEGVCHEDPEVETRRVWRGRPWEEERLVYVDRDQNRADDRRGRTVNISFYEVGSGRRSSMKYADKEPLGDLKAAYCAEHKLDKGCIKFEIWDYEVLDIDTWSELRRKHHLGKEFTIDVSILS